MQKVFFVLLVSLFLCAVSFGRETSNADKECTAIKKVIEEAYVKGIHIHRDPVAIRKGFHPKFNMLVLKDEKIIKVPIEKWIEKIEAGKKKNPGPVKIKTTHEFSLVNVTGNAAVAKIEVYKGSKHTYTDYMSLYKFKDGWKIVNKIFQSHK